MKKNREGSTSVQTVTVTEPEGLEVLLPEEEKVLRMRHGLSEDDSHVLQYAVGASDESKAKLALIEEALLSAFYDDVSTFEE